MRNKILKLFISLIPIKSTRRFLRGYFFDEDFRLKLKEQRKMELLNDRMFKSYAIKQKSVLIVEPNSYHGEILPGFVKYFQDCGFNVDLFLRHENDGDDIFCRFEEDRPNIFKGTDKHLKKLLSMKKVNQYEYVFFSSSAYWQPHGFYNSYLNYLGFEPRGKNGLLMVEHNVVPFLKEYGEEKYLNENKLFSLSGFDNTPMLNPHYFGKVKITQKSKDKTVFIVVGGINKDCKNHDLLLTAAQKLLEEGLDFEVVVVGGGGKLEIPEELRSVMNFKGRLSFNEMFDEMERADFFLPLLDPAIEAHKRYLKGTTSGSRQLVLGFLKPCLINEEFAKVYGLDDTNSFVHEGNELFEAMKSAIQLSELEYSQKQNSLKRLAGNIYQQSLDNLKKAVKNEQ